MPAATRVVGYYALPGSGPGAADRLATLARTANEYARARRLVVLEPFVESRADARGPSSRARSRTAARRARRSWCRASSPLAATSRSSKRCSAGASR
jgi:hypothetical protein